MEKRLRGTLLGLVFRSVSKIYNKEKPSLFSLDERRMIDYKAKMEKEKNSIMMQNNLYRLWQCFKVWNMEVLSSEFPGIAVKMQTAISNLLN